MIAHGNKIKIFAGNGSQKLGAEIAKELNMQLGAIRVGKFSDGETSIQIDETVRGCDVFLIQSTSTPVNDNLVELLVMIDAMRRASAGRITAVIPYFGYARQDRKARARDPITAKLVADLITSAGADRVLTMDLHSPQIQGFFDIPVDNLLGSSVLVDKIRNKAFVKRDDFVVVSPDVGSVSRARAFATKLEAGLAIVDKRRPKANVMEVMNIVGDVNGKTCLLVDDMIDTAGTITQGAKALVEVGGAKEVYVCCTHGVLSGPAIERMKDSVIKKVYMLNTIDIPDEHRLPMFEEISVAPLFARAIESIFAELPLSRLYD